MKAIAIFFLVALCSTQGQEYQYNYQLQAPAPSYAPQASYGSSQSSSYGSAPASYGAAPAPVYNAMPSYGPAHAGPSHSYTYPSPAPPVPCPTNLLLSCAPQVAPVPCQSVQYAKPSYAPAAAPSRPTY